MLTPQQKQQGFGLIEMLVAGLVITIGLIGMLLLQANTQRDAFNAHRLSMAGLYAQDLQERLRANMCFLSPKVNDQNEPEKEIKDLIKDELDDFLDDLRKQWVNTHFTGGRSGWEAWLTPVFDGSNPQEKAEKIFNDGYWRFNLDVCFSDCPEYARHMTQRLLVEHNRWGCAP